jgi:hypothetical protein
MEDDYHNWAEDAFGTLSSPQQALIDALKCPAYWLPNLRTREDFHAVHLTAHLNQLWVRTLHDTSALGDEALSVLSDPEHSLWEWVAGDLGGVSLASAITYFGNTTEIDKLRATIDAAHECLPEVKDIFLSRHDVVVWQSMHVGDRSDYPKHFVHPSITRSEVIKKTRGRNTASLLFSETEQYLSVILLKLLNEVASFDNFELIDRIPFQTSKVFVDLLDAIGAARGDETTILCYQIDGSTGLAHCYPISMQEVQEVRGDTDSVPLYYIDDFQGMFGAR